MGIGGISTCWKNKKNIFNRWKIAARRKCRLNHPPLQTIRVKDKSSDPLLVTKHNTQSMFLNFLKVLKFWRLLKRIYQLEEFLILIFQQTIFGWKKIQLFSILLDPSQVLVLQSNEKVWKHQGSMYHVNALNYCFVTPISSCVK